MDKQVILNIISVILIIILYFLKDFKDWYKVRRKKSFFNQNVELDILIEKDLSYITDKYSFNRVSIIKYHNGTESFDNFSFNFASMTHERTDNTTQSVIKDFQRVPLTSFSHVLVDLKKSKEGMVILTSDDSSQGVMQSGWGVTQSHNFMLTDKVSDGIICCVVTHGTLELSTHDVTDIKSIAYRINMLLEKQK